MGDHLHLGISFSLCYNKYEHTHLITMLHTRKVLGLLSVSTVAIGSFLFLAPAVGAYINAENIQKPAAPSREQAQVQLQLAERARDLARQYESRRFGMGEESPADGESAEPVDASVPSSRSVERERMTSTQPSSEDAQTSLASVRSSPVARNLPKLPGSGFGLPIVALALGATGALRGRKKSQSLA